MCFRGGVKPRRFRAGLGACGDGSFTRPASIHAFARRTARHSVRATQSRHMSRARTSRMFADRRNPAGHCALSVEPFRSPPAACRIVKGP
jgi:hypothetical protein